MLIPFDKLSYLNICGWKKQFQSKDRMKVSISFQKIDECVWYVCVYIYVNTFPQVILPKYMLGTETILIKGHNEGKYKFPKVKCVCIC